MDRDPDQKILRYINGLEKTNKYLMIALREMHKYVVSIEQANEDLVKKLNSYTDSSSTAVFGDMSESQQRTLLHDLDLIHDLDLLNDHEVKFSDDTRENIRKPYNMVVDYVAQDRFCNDFIKNVSSGGMFIETRMPFLVGQDIILTFPLPKNRKHVKIAGEVIRTTAQGIGVKFKIANEDQEAVIKSLLEMI
ncbi:MAG: PilZ domain-containing protein [Deltaproteobacteria bacterium]|nr:PilZ domain-containing protein [Deltaproteobacteria bacterium]